MLRLIPRAVAAALLGAIVGPACLILMYAWNPAVAFDMDEALPAFATGFYPIERAGQETFVWTAARAELTLDGLDRRVDWACTIRFRGARPASLPQPVLDVAVDGLRAAAFQATNDFQDVGVPIHARPNRRGLVLTLTSTAPFTPGADPRELGVQIDRLSCRPSTRVVLPPPRALGASALSAAAFGAGAGLIGATAGSAVGAAAAMAAGQALPMSASSAIFSSHPATMVRLACWLAFLMVVIVRLVEVSSREALRNTARFAIAFSAGALYLQLAALLHPSKGLVDALFHAHRFDAVLAGQFFFTQLSTSATPFPYAIGLYVFAAPWAWLTSNHVALLRIVVSASEIVAGALLYLMVVRAWGDRLVAAVSVALFAMAPVSYVVIGNANLTGAFGQAVSVIAVTVAATWGECERKTGPLVGLILLATLGLVSHVASLLLLTATLGCVVVLFAVAGRPPVRRAAGWVAAGSVAAVLLAIVLYWGHFGGVYAAQVARLRSPAAAAADATPPAAAAMPGQAAPAGQKRQQPLGDRLSGAPRQTVENIGWPVLGLALVGAWRIWAERARDRLVLVLGAWGIVWLAFVGFSVLWSSDPKYLQDAWEFIARVEHASLPVASVLAARGAVWAWRANGMLRVASGAMLASAVFLGVRAWVGWLN